MAKSNFEYKNLSKMHQDCLRIVESLGIYELRGLARVFGDSAPTTLKRNDHINIIMSKIISGDDLEPIPLRQGRPYKELSNIEGILNELSAITGKNYNLKSSQSSYISSEVGNKSVTFSQIEESIVSKKMFPVEASGIVCEWSENHFYLLNQKHHLILKA